MCPYFNTGVLFLPLRGSFHPLKSVPLPLCRATAQVLRLCEQRKALQEYLSGKMDLVSPNLKAVVGEVLGARLISHAGALVSLAKYPASTIQILGAEKVGKQMVLWRGQRYSLLQGCENPLFNAIF